MNFSTFGRVFCPNVALCTVQTTTAKVLTTIQATTDQPTTVSKITEKIIPVKKQSPLPQDTCRVFESDSVHEMCKSEMNECQHKPANGDTEHIIMFIDETGSMISQRYRRLIMKVKK